MTTGPAHAGKFGPAAAMAETYHPPITIAAGQAMPASCGVKHFEARILALVNRIRAIGANCGAAGVFGPAIPLRWNWHLTAAARGHTEDMATMKFFHHTSARDGRGVANRIFATGQEWGEYGENISAGGWIPEEIVARWHNSPRHCANLMNPSFTDVGAACMPAAQPSRYQTYWTMDLAGP